ncbi:MAG: response regulator [Verrucomicrobiota bacterium]
MASELILVIDDHPQNLKLARVLLSKHGYRVQTAADAQEAWASLADETPRLILMDVQLPGTDGLHLTRMLKGDPRYAHIPIIAVTAYAMKGDEERVRAAGCDGYVSKPLDLAALLQIVADRLGRPGGG